MYLSEKNKVYYEVINKYAKKDFLIFIHGLGSNSTEWKGIMDLLKKEGYPVMSVDLRGHGKSQLFNSYRLEDFASDINKILEKERIKKKVILIGHSMGGMVSLIFFKHFKKSVHKLILINTTYKNIGKTSPLRVFLPLTKIVLKHWNNTKGSIDFSNFKNKPAGYTFVKTAIQNNTKVLLECINNMIDYDASKIIKEINIPVLIIASRYDKVFTLKTQRYMHRNIKNSTLKILDGTHLIIIKTPNLISKEILDFIIKK